MKYRVSFYRKDEVVNGRAPRYMEEVEAKNVAEATGQFEAPGVTIRSVYKAPSSPPRQTPSFVFLTSAARNKWYKSHKSKQEDRICKDCGVNPVKRYKRLCVDCATSRSTTSKNCISCSKSIPSSSRKRYCEACAKTRKDEQEKLHREKRAKVKLVERIQEQVAWAQEKLKTTTIPACKLSSRFQGLRQPHLDVKNEQGTFVGNPNRCRSCLQKFIDVQSVYLSNILAEASPEESTNAATAGAN